MEGRTLLSLLHVVAALVVLLQLHGGAIVVASEPPYSCGAGAPPNIPFCDAGLPIDRCVDDLVSRMTVVKKTSQLGDQSPAIPRLGVPAYKWWSEALHGISNQGRGIHLDGPLRAATSYHRSSSPPRPSTRTSCTASARYASTDAKRIIDEERANARLEIGSAKASVQKIQSALKEQEKISHRTGKQDVDELKEEVQEAPRVKMLHCPSKAMDIENEIQVLCDQLAKKSSDSLRLLKELELHRSYGENDMPLYELKGLETLGSTLHIVVHDCASVDFWNGTTKPAYAPEPHDVGRYTQAEVKSGGQTSITKTVGSVDPVMVS
ncbi:Stomatal closure-related actin-binding protein 1 [Zea mays]|uniref:Stomatal closure-related actin-binding protein 1 n=1 Tax=Zea mays TaxID=4577 RepID=A0A3L6FF57_MAIZE|nr:Stomatal closure-related actin-binding protein 1 [Zea mays]